MQWRVVAVGAAVGLVLFVVGTYQMLDTVWPRTPSLSRSADEVEARWAAHASRTGKEPMPGRADSALVDAMVALGGTPAEEPVSPELVLQLVEALRAGASVPSYGCTILPLQGDASRHVSPYDWLEAAKRLVDFGEVELATQIATELWEGQDLVPFAVGLAVLDDIARREPAALPPTPTSEELFDSLVHTAQCADEVMGRFTWDDAEDYFGQGRVPPKWWYDPARDRLALRDYYGTLLTEVEPVKGDRAAMASLLEDFDDRDHPVRRSLVSRIVTSGAVPMARGLLAQMERLDAR